MKVGTIDYKELVFVTEWTQKFFTEEYYFQFVEKDCELVLRAIMPLSNGCVSAEDYPINRLKREGYIR